MTNNDAQPLVPPASAQVVAKQLIAMVDPICDRYGVSKNKRLRDRRGLLMKAGMAEALYMAAQQVLSLTDADQLHWLADAIAITLPQEKPVAWRADLEMAAWLVCPGIMFLAMGSIGARTSNEIVVAVTVTIAGLILLGASVLPLRRLWLARRDIWNGR